MVPAETVGPFLIIKLEDPGVTAFNEAALLRLAGAIKIRDLCVEFVGGY